ncbi:DUF6284 family protein [Streptomyces sp. NBC_01198]|uniref:DUF6284 family protein n=1 Tax=Streptomyces sp. NBC_01198 TaxID=2903769 RepID=UPI002E1057E3|nr:DUF6284 family protein [Streptomyces sp. NBC_01198]
MQSIDPEHDVPAVCVLDDQSEPTDAELSAIEREMPVILARVDLLDVEISLLDRGPTELDTRRVRRAHNRLLTARRELANATVRELPAGGAA